VAGAQRARPPANVLYEEYDMINSRAIRQLARLIIFCAIFSTSLALPLLSSAKPATSVNIVNNSSRVIRFVYVSHVNVDDWSGDQLGGNGISPGQSSTVSNFACDQQQVRVIGEDQDGCFVSAVVACGENSTWTITNETPVDCGQ
jgi:hypothetical protein